MVWGSRPDPLGFDFVRGDFPTWVLDCFQGDFTSAPILGHWALVVPSHINGSNLETDQSLISLLKLSIAVSQSANRFESTKFPSSEEAGEKVSDKMGATWTLSWRLRSASSCQLFNYNQRCLSMSPINRYSLSLGKYLCKKHAVYLVIRGTNS